MFRENIIAELKDKIARNPQDVENYKNLANYYIGCEDLCKRFQQIFLGLCTFDAFHSFMVLSVVFDCFVTQM